MEKITKNSGQAFESLTEFHEGPHPNVMATFNESRTPYAGNPFFDYNDTALAVEEWNRINVEKHGHELLDPMRCMMLYMNLIRRETPNVPQLDALAEDVVREMYDVPEHVDISVKREAPDSADGCDDEPSKIELEEKLIPFFHKRQLINCISHGAAVFQWASAFFMAKEYLDALDETLIEDYKNFSRSINYWNWFIDPDMVGGQLGQCEVKNDKEEIKVTATALAFPLLIHEISKGVLELVAQWGLTSDEEFITLDEQQKVVEKADDYLVEKYHYFVGPSVWRRMLEAHGDTAATMMPKLAELYKLPPQQFLQQMRSIVYDLKW